MVVIEIERGTKIYFTSSNNPILAQTCLHFLNKESENLPDTLYYVLLSWFSGYVGKTVSWIQPILKLKNKILIENIPFINKSLKNLLPVFNTVKPV